MKHAKKNYRRQEAQRPPKKDTRQTQRSGGSLSEKLIAYRDLQAHALFSSLGRLLSAKFTSGMTITVLAIAIAMATGFYLVVKNLQQLTGNLEASNQISLFLKDEIAEGRAKRFADTIQQNPSIQSVKLITKEQALKEFVAYSGFGDAMNALEKNPLPIVIEVIPKSALQDSKSMTVLMQEYNQSPEVDFAQMDKQWVDRLQAIMDIANQSSKLVSSILGLAVLFITGNTIRLELNNRREEVVIEKLVGATDAFIQRPFLYFGFWIGFLSGVFAWLIVTIVMLLLKQPIEKLSGLYEGAFHIVFLGFLETLSLLLISCALGIVGSWAVLKYQLHQLKPE